MVEAQGCKKNFKSKPTYVVWKDNIIDLFQLLLNLIILPGVAVFAFNRPKVMNAMGRKLMSQVTYRVQIMNLSRT